MAKEIEHAYCSRQLEEYEVEGLSVVKQVQVPRT